MSTPDDRPTAEQPAVAPEPSVSTAPPPDARRSRWSRIPAHVGPARTSTVVLVVLFLAFGVLYLYVKPETTATGTVTGGEPAPASTEAPPTTTAPTTPAPTEETRTTTPGPTAPEETTPGEPTGSSEPTTTGTPTPTPTSPTLPTGPPTTSAPPG